MYKFEEQRYEKYFISKNEAFESLCKRCGVCCGSKDGDPCINLKFFQKTGKYHCNSYNNRLGEHKTISGASFKCVPIKILIEKNLLPPNCAYR